MFESLLQELQKYNSRANWSNLIAGVALLLVLAGGSVWYFTKGREVSPNEVKEEKSEEVLSINNETKKEEEATKKESESKNNPFGGYTKPVVKVLPNTSSK